MSYNSSFTGQQADAAIQKAAVIQMDNDGTKFLADDGTYKEAGDKTNVLILSLENDLAGGQKDSPVTAEVSASLVDAITTGKACVIKSANSDILSNLQKIGNNVTIIMEQISRVGQTFVAVNTSITVNTATNVISNYQTGAIVLETEGDGNKFLADDGKYKNISEKYSSRTFVLFSSDFAGSSYVLKPIEAPSDWSEQMVITSENSNASGFLLASDVSEDGSKYAVRFTYSGTTYPAQGSWKLQNNVTGDIMQILAVVIQSQKVLSESEYSALGTTPETDNVLYFVTPD